MPEDASIDDFLPDDGGEEGDLGEADGGEGADGDDAVSDAAGDDATVPADGVDPASPTSRWSAGDDGCEACGGDASRLWRDGERFVCADCKSWAGE